MTQALANTKRYLSQAIGALLDLIYPPHCVACDAPGSWFCAECEAAIARIPESICHHCGRPYSGEALCVACRGDESSLDAMRAFALHEEPISHAVHALKYDGLRVLAPQLGAYLAEAYVHYGLRAQVIIPVPLHHSRQRQRGYNQAYLLARELSRLVEVDVDRRLLKRTRKTRSQVGLSGGERWDNMTAAFRCAGDDLGGMRVLLIDDVMTTGATLESCAKALREAGAGHVQALTLTQAPHGPRARHQ